jgi:hypothetical protein
LPPLEPFAAAHTGRYARENENSVAAGAADGVGDMRARNAQIAKDMIVEGGKFAYCSALFAEAFNLLKYSHFSVSFVCCAGDKHLPA